MKLEKINKICNNRWEPARGASFHHDEANRSSNVAVVVSTRAGNASDLLEDDPFTAAENKRNSTVIYVRMREKKIGWGPRSCPIRRMHLRKWNIPDSAGAKLQGTYALLPPAKNGCLIVIISNKLKTLPNRKLLFRNGFESYLTVAAQSASSCGKAESASDPEKDTERFQFRRRRGPFGSAKIAARKPRRTYRK